MLHRYFLINLILLIIIGILAFKFYSILTHPVEIPSKPGISKVKEEETEISKDKPLDKEFFKIIAEKDLFRPSRTAPLLKKNTSPSTQTLLKKPPRVFGTVISNVETIALIEDPVTKSTKSYHVNDSVAGFIISEIQKDKVIFLRGDEKIEVKLREPKGFKAKRPILPPQKFRRSPPPSPQKLPSSKKKT
jgi:type II secretory pathway component PulC